MASPTGPRPRRGAHRSGVTLIELLLSLSILAIIGTLTVTMMVSMSRGTQGGREMRSRNLRLEVLCARIDSRVRSSVRVLAADGRSLVLWLGDERPNSVPDVAELCRIEWNATTGAIVAYVAPADLLPVDNVALPFTTNFDTASRSLVAGGVLEPEVLGRKVKRWAVENVGTPAETWRSVTYQLELADHPGFDHVGVAALRGE